MQTRYDVIVVGAGHAGCEAAHAAARLGCRTLLLTIDLDKLAHMSCNPSIGGPAKGHLVREIDAMGGLMGRITDRSAIQIRLLNESKGPAVQSLRAQCDKRLYARLMKETLERVPNLDLRQAMVERIAPPNADTQCFTVTTHTGWRYLAPAVILTTGTFLRGRAITGEAVWGAGRAGEAPAMALSEDLAALGFPLVRLKTGTPPRLAAATIDFSLTELQPGSDKPLAFGHYYAELGETIPPPEYHGPPAPVYPHPQLNGWRPQLPCYQVHTTPEFHAIIRQNLHRAPLFSGIIEGVGPRYCPSIEDKIVRFADKERHSLFLEPEGWTTAEVYVQGCNTSLPEDVQWAMLRSIPALRNVELMRIGYAIEYDAVATGEITADMQTRRLRGLFFAGQINGTTGYEEAAAQGLMAGINAAHYVQGKPPVILGRAEAYIGVLIDDLTTKEIREPYRMFTSRAEYRLLLRGDNADLRLTPLAYRLGLVDGDRAAVVEQRRRQAEQALQQMHERCIFPSAAINNALEAQGVKPLNQPATVAEVLARPDVSYRQLRTAIPDLPDLSPSVAEQVEIGCKYRGYIARQEREVARMQKMEHRRIPPDFDYTTLPGLRNEARQVLMRFRPATLGQAGRLAGINPADVAIILFALERRQVHTDTEATYNQ
ncbi:tRNA uridine-5-carboxymethylaminomethyl modification enzyme MnmG/GidA [Chloroflexus aggregans]|uniref:tRNA uridine 5-carboxymethylaminomethyl modification enzyme MnmG n=1 Tax=Chloroflexus aggregans (strain MD-66 / DSM 9485) TaxID=326427 RepID=B8GCX0_CHLAD|nr:tRNA uridine-5-carboxymethylaminomethyl(34) synthesis enzyme MnmG [Chloroflexus aggregans]ACL23170.1 glucose inhibited division protein A [Chloroflexus aggregans DSM 9485]